MSQEITFPELLHYLKTSSSIELCLRPDVPRNEKHYKFLDHQVIDTTTGQLLILDLEDVKTQEKITISYPDIQSFEINDHSNFSMQKFYINCNSRKSYFDYQEKLEMEKLGLKLDAEEMHDSWENSQMVFRIMTHK